METFKEYSHYKKKFANKVLEQLGDKVFTAADFTEKFMRLEKYYGVDVKTPTLDAEHRYSGGWAFTDFDRVLRFLKSRKGYDKVFTKGRYYFQKERVGATPAPTPNNGVPAYTMGALRRYVDEGMEPGGFLTAVLSNDLFNAIGRADGTNAAALENIVRHIYCHEPFDCWGSKERVTAWLDKKRAERGN